MKKIFNKVYLTIFSLTVLPFAQAVAQVRLDDPLTRSIDAQNARITGGAGLFENPISGIKDIYSLIYAILDFVAKAGSIVVIVMIIYSGFLFVKAQGNESEISKAKETFFWSVIGAIILLGAKALALVVCNTANGLGAGVSCSFMR